MTWYWWTHWFWITTMIVICITDQINVVGTYPISPPYGNKEYSKEKPLKFPLAAQTDLDDVFISGEEILSAVFRDSKPIRQKDTMPRNSNPKLSENVVMPQSSALGEAKKLLNISNKTINIAEDKLNRTKAVDINLVNNSSLVSTQSPLESNSSESEAIGITEININTDSQHSSSFSSSISANNNNNTDYENNSFESLEELPRNKTSSIMTIAKDKKNPFITSLNLDNITKEEAVIRGQLDVERGRKSKVLAEYRQELKFNFSADTKNLLARSAAISIDDFNQEQDDGNISSEALSIQRAYILDAGAISGICFAVVGLFCGVTMAGVVLYRRRYLNKPQALSEPDSSGYIDDSTIRDNSDEMYSLDNDSFLNSLEAMTIQNYWTDTVKHTKL